MKIKNSQKLIYCSFYITNEIIKVSKFLLMDKYSKYLFKVRQYQRVPTVLLPLLMTSSETPSSISTCIDVTSFEKMAHFQSDNDSDGEIPEIDLTLRIQPYMYEPTSMPTRRGRVDSPEKTSDSEEENEPQGVEHPEEFTLTPVEKW